MPGHNLLSRVGSGPAGWWRGARRLAALGAGALLLEAAYAVLRPVPEFDEFDASAEFGEAAAPPLHVTVLGDSTCTGPGLSGPEEIWISLVCQRLAARGRRVVLRSLAEGGATSSGVLASQVPRAADRSSDLTFISVGTNDLIRQVPLPRIEANLEMIVARLRPVSRIVILAGIGDLGTIPRLLPPIRHFASRRGQQGDRVHARVADRHGTLKAEMWGNAAHAFRTQPGIFSADLFHPTAAGHRVWADAAWDVLAPHLDRLPGGREATAGQG